MSDNPTASEVIQYIEQNWVGDTNLLFTDVAIDYNDGVLKIRPSLEKVRTIVDSTEEKDAQISRVAALLRQFLKETQDPKRWDARTSRAEVGGFMRSWARKIIKEVGK